MDIRNALNQATAGLAKAEIPSARLDAELLLALCLRQERIFFYKYPEQLLEEAELSRFWKLVGRRRQGEPIAYITGRKEFWSFALEVNRDVLIPRPDTEVLVDETINICQQIDAVSLQILDIGTGSGAIALALAQDIPHVRIVATDISAAALAVAKNNARNFGLDSLIDFRQGDLFNPVKELFDVIVSNPPYIADEEYKGLPRGIKEFEPQEALRAGVDGTDFYRKIISQAPGHLQNRGWLLLEIGATQGASVGRLLEASGHYNEIDIRNDYAGHPRVIKARRKV